MKAAHETFDPVVDTLSMWTRTVSAPGAGQVAEVPVDDCQQLSSYSLCSGAGNLVNSSGDAVQLPWRVRAKSASGPSSEWSRWRYLDTNWSQPDYWYVPNRAGSYIAGNQAGDEASGLIASKQYPGVFWFIRDAGKPEDRNKLYAIKIDPNTGRLTNIDGYTTKEISVSGVDNVDWESLSADDSGNLWIGDVGNYYRDDSPGLTPAQAEGQDRYRNSTSEPDLRLYRVPEPNPETQSTVAATKTAPFQYPDAGEYNSEATFWLGGYMFLITKTYDTAKIYRFPGYISPTQANNTLRYVGEVRANGIPPITDAAVSDDNSRIALTTEGSRALIYEGAARSANTAAEAEDIVTDLLSARDASYHYYYRSAGALQADGDLNANRPTAGPAGQWNQTTMAIEGVAWQPGSDRLNMVSEYGRHVLSVPRVPTRAFRIDETKDNYSYWGWAERRGNGSGLPTGPDNGSTGAPPSDPTPTAAVPLPAGSTWNYRDNGVRPAGFQSPY